MEKAKVKVVYEDGEDIRAAIGNLLDETDKWIKLELNNSILQIHIDHIYKIEYIKTGRTNFEY